MATHLSYDVLSRLVERRAGAVDDARAQRHLASCGRCRSELAWLERIRSLPQRTADFGHGVQQAVDGLGDGWGNHSASRQPPSPRTRREQDGPDAVAKFVAPYWLRSGSSALLG